MGAEHADGLLLVRHGMEWSDPTFVTLSNFDVGFLAGVSRSELLMYVLTDRAVRQFLSGAGRVSGSGGLCWMIGAWGAGSRRYLRRRAGPDH
ncbi:Tat pathway signal sequence domain protein [Acetobacteraceae bacterium AT-5844]|nr:Tat pathway signal sequence domain protein [Acetobacteraceae bacterium AT-5844]